MKKGVVEQHLKRNGDADDTFKNECHGFEWIEKDTFETHIRTDFSATERRVRKYDQK